MASLQWLRLAAVAVGAAVAGAGAVPHAHQHDAHHHHEHNAAVDNSTFTLGGSSRAKSDDSTAGEVGADPSTGPALPNPKNLACSSWTPLLHHDDAFGKVAGGCTGGMEKPPCAVGIAPGCPSQLGSCDGAHLAYLYLGSMTSLEDCESAATNLELIEGSPTQKAAAAVAAAAGETTNPPLACRAVTYHHFCSDATASPAFFCGPCCRFAKKCFCATTMPGGGPAWIAPSHPDSPAAPTDSAYCSSYYVINPHDWGWDLMLLLSLSAVVFVGAGSLWNAKGRGRRGWDVLPAVKEVKQLAGLVRDGVGFSVALARGQPQATPGPKDVTDKDGPSASLLGGKSGGSGGAPRTKAEQGRPSLLHHAATLGTASKLRGLLADSGGAAMAALNAGDERRYTAFHIACAGGHVDCVRLLLEAGCDTALCNHSGLTGWELADELHRSEVLVLRGLDAAASPTGGSASSGGRSGGSGGSRSKKGKKKDKRSSSKDKRLGGAEGKTVDEDEGPIKVVAAANGMKSIML